MVSSQPLRQQQDARLQPCTRALGDDVRQQSNFTECSMEELNMALHDFNTFISKYGGSESARKAQDVDDLRQNLSDA